MKMFLFEPIHGYIKPIRTSLFRETVLGNYDYSSISNVDQSSIPKLGTAQWSEFYCLQRLQCLELLYMLMVENYFVVFKSKYRAMGRDPQLLNSRALLTFIAVLLMRSKDLQAHRLGRCWLVRRLASHVSHWPNCGYVHTFILLSSTNQTAWAVVSTQGDNSFQHTN